MDLSRLVTDSHEICTQVWCGVKLKKLIFENFPPLKIGGGKT